MKKNKKNLKASDGFTLLELIIVFTIIAILSTIGIASFVSYSKSQSLQGAASDLASTLNLAKARASSQVKPSECNGTLSGYKVIINDPTLSPGINNYSLYVVCGEDHPIKKVTLPDNGNITFDLDKTTQVPYIFFPVITGIPQGAGDTVLTGYNQSRCVNVSPTGVIKISAIKASDACPK